jgi:hypothetical protein
MEIKDITETVQKCGEYAMRAVDRDKVLFDDRRDREAVAASWLQAKMLGEIAYQLAVLNGRDEGEIRRKAIEDAVMNR